jgi:transcription antitermination factor NusG
MRKTMANKASKPKPKFKVNDWIRIVSGPEKGRTTTITNVAGDAESGFVYVGYFCGVPISAKEEDVQLY